MGQKAQRALGLKTLVSALWVYYTKSMKTTTLILTLILSACCAFSSTGPGNTKHALRRLASKEATGSKKAPITAIKTLSNAHNKEATSLTSPMNYRRLGQKLEVLMSQSAHKQLLNRRQAFQHEINAMSEILPCVIALQTNPTPSELTWVELLIKDQVINQTLSTTLLQLLEKKDYAMLAQEISDYYAIPLDRDLETLSCRNLREEVVNSALNYALRHPHKPNLPLRELLKSWKVTERTKTHLRKFLNYPGLLEQSQTEFKQFVRDAYNQHQKGLRQSYNSPEVQATIRAYTLTLEELRSFLAKHHRQPMWNSPANERRLYNTLQLILTRNTTNTFYETETIKRQMRDLLSEYPNRPFYEFKEDFDAFRAKHNRLPQSLQERPSASLHERTLYEEMVRFMTDGQLILTK